MAIGTSNIGMDKLNNLDPEVLAKFQQIIKNLNDKGYHVQINSSYRDFSKQETEFLTNSQATIPGGSSHNSGLAIDFNVFDENNKIFGKGTSPSEWEATGIPQMFNENGLRWGGDFGFNDDKLEELRKQQLSNFSGPPDPNLDSKIEIELKKRDEKFHDGKNSQYDPIHGDLKNNPEFQKFDKNLNLTDEQKEIRSRWREIKNKKGNIDVFDAHFIKIRQGIKKIKDNLLKKEFKGVPNQLIDDFNIPTKNENTIA
jgi:hypothetical protein